MVQPGHIYCEVCGAAFYEPGDHSCLEALRATIEAKDAEIVGAKAERARYGDIVTSKIGELERELAEAKNGNEALLKALAEIADMKPNEVEYELPDHSECEECKRIQSNKYHLSTCCNGMYRELMERDARYEREYSAQQYRMRNTARAAIAALGKDGE